MHRKKNDFAGENSAWSGKMDRMKSVSHMVSKGMTHTEAEKYLDRDKKVEAFLREHENACYTRFRGKMISFGYNP